MAIQAATHVALEEREGGLGGLHLRSHWPQSGMYSVALYEPLDLIPSTKWSPEYYQMQPLNTNLGVTPEHIKVWFQGQKHNQKLRASV